MIGIYKIENLITKDCYIGSSLNIEKRKNQHFNSLNRGKNNSIFLQAAYDKYGFENFKFEIIENCDKDILIQKEQYYLDTIIPLYNICKKAYSTKGRKVSDETKNKLRERNFKLGIKPPESTWRNRMKKVEMLDKNTEEVLIEFESLSEAARYFNKSGSFGTNISKVCRGLLKTSYNYKWRYKNESRID